MPKNENALPTSHWIWTAFDKLNMHHFGGRLQRPGEILRMTSKSHHARSVNAAVRMIWLDGDTIDTDRAKATDSLLHEMIHYELAGDAGGDGDAEHGPRFVARADEIGRALGLLPCDLPGATPDQVHQFASVWPQVQRELAS